MNVNSGTRRRFLIVRHRTYRRFFFSIIVRWVRVNLPQLAPYFEVRDLPARVRDWSRYTLHVPWLQDPVERWSTRAYDQAMRLAEQCDQQGIAVVNRVDRLINATKSRGAQLMSGAGVSVPRMAVVRQPEEFQETLLGLRLPLFIREDWGHDRKMLRIDTRDDVRRIPWDTFERPVAIELIDVRDPRDGMYRKYRYVAAGDLGVSHHLHISQGWVTRGEGRIIRRETRDEELNYVSRPDVNHEMLQRARRALGLDLVAFDYGYTPDGKMIVWEANPFPHCVYATRRLMYKNAAMHRTLLAIVHLYFAAAGLPIPDEVADGLGLDFAAVDRRYQIVRKTNLLDRLLALPRTFPKWAA